MKGPRLPSLKTVASHRDTPWQQRPVAWYDNTTRVVAVTSQCALWYRTGKPPLPIRCVLVQDPTSQFPPQALLCTDPDTDPFQVVQWFVLRWQLEVTFQEVRSHLGVETQRQWSDRAITRTTPVLMGLFSWIALAACLLQQNQPIAPRTAAWYPKPAPTFVDTIALVRRHLWLASLIIPRSHEPADRAEIPAALYSRLIDTLAHAA